MQKIAYMMLEEYNKSEPKLLKEGEWHIPFNENITIFNPNYSALDYEKERIKVSTSRCARVSYTVVGTENRVKENYEDVELHDKLLSMGHMSPFEHCAKSMSNSDRYRPGENWSGNFKGFIQYRKTLKEENKTDQRVIQK